MFYSIFQLNFQWRIKDLYTKKRRRKKMGSFQSFLLQGPDIKDNMTLILLSLAQITQPSRRGADGRRREVALWPELKKSSKNYFQLFCKRVKYFTHRYILRLGTVLDIVLKTLPKKGALET